MGVGAWGHRGMCPHVQRPRKSAPFLVAWFPSLKALMMLKQLAKYTFPAIFRSSFKISLVTCPRTLLANLHLGTCHFHHAKSFIVSVSAISPGKMFKAPFTREQFQVEPYQNCTDRPRIYTGTDGAVPHRTASGTGTGPPRR